MKKLLYSLCTFTFALSAVSCVKEMVEAPVAQQEEYEGFPVTLFVEDNEWKSENDSKTGYTPGQGVAIDGTEKMGLYYLASDGKYYGSTAVTANSVAVLASPTSTKGVYSMKAPAASEGCTWYAIMPFSKYLNKNTVVSAEANKSYIATKLPAIQYPKANSFDPMCDILIARPFTLSGTGEQSGTITAFKRLSAPLKINITGLADSDKIYSVSLAFSQAPVKTTDAVQTLAGHFILNTGTQADDVSIHTMFSSNTAENAVSAVYPEALEKQGDSWPAWFSVMPVTFAAGGTLTVTVTTQDAVLSRQVSLPSKMEIKAGKINDLSFNIKGEGFESANAISQDFVNNGLSGKTTSTPSLTASDGNAYTWGYTNVTPWTGAANDGGSDLSDAINLQHADSPALTFPTLSSDKDILKARIFLHPLTMSFSSGVSVTLKNGDTELKKYEKFCMMTTCADYCGAGYFDIDLPSGTTTLEGTSIHISDATAGSTYFAVSRVVLFTSKSSAPQKDFNFVFTNGKTFSWPFTSPAVTEISAKVATPSFAGEDTYLSFTSGSKDYEFIVYATTGMCKNGASGFGVCAKSGDYIIFPQVEGMYLSSVSFVSAKTTKADVVALHVVNTSGKAVKGGDTINSFTADGITQWKLIGTSSDDQYMFEFTNTTANWIWFKQLQLHYTNTQPAMDSYDIDINLYPAGSRVWPFASPTTLPARQADAQAVAGAATFTYNTSIGTLEFPIYTTNGYLSNSVAGWLFGHGEGDYFQFPALDGLYLTEVKLNVGTANTNGCPGICTTDGTPVMGGGAFSHTASVDEEYKWTLYGTEKNTPYRLYLSTGTSASGQNLSMRRLRLHYSKDPLEDPSKQFQEVKEDEIPDFSTCGYHYGDKAIPTIETKVTLEAPTDGSDCTEMIQNAIDNVASPGAVLLKAGTYNVQGQILINRDGVVLRGEGTSTIIKSTSTGVREGEFEWGETGYLSAVVRVGAAAFRTNGAGSDIIAKYVPAGQMWVPVLNPERFSVGETVVLFRKATAEWIHAIKMDTMPQGGAPWQPSDFNSMFWERKIVKIDGYKLYFDAPVVMGIGLWGTSGVVYKCTTNRPSEIGVEDIKFDTIFSTSGTQYVAYRTEYKDEKHTWCAVEFISADNSWAKGITSEHFSLSCVALRAGAIRCTVFDCACTNPVSLLEGSRRYAFAFHGSQLCLVKDCTCEYDRHSFLTNARVPGPNVFLRCTSNNTYSHVGPHGLWATGTLYDNVKVNGSYSDAFLQNIDRSCYEGVAQGWPGANTVFYNCESEHGNCFQQPYVSAKTWNIGCTGTWYDKVKNYYDTVTRPTAETTSYGTHVTPSSLYEDQLAKRHAAGTYYGK